MPKYGLSGYLAPDGEWYHCEYQEHSSKALELVEKYKLDETDCNNIALVGEFIKFGTVPWTGKEGNSMCHVFMNKYIKPTKQQIDWLNQNLNEATDKQKEEVLFTFTAFYEMDLNIT